MKWLGFKSSLLRSVVTAENSFRQEYIHGFTSQTCFNLVSNIAQYYKYLNRGSQGPNNTHFKYPKCCKYYCTLPPG